MLKLTVAGLLIWGFWEPLQPARQFTANALYGVADVIYTENN